ncbi:MAG: pepsin/retropepsin-like aspartic protease family protein [Candidatus Aminicenantes bacterium]
MEGRFEKIRVPLVTPEQHRSIRMISLELNGKADYLFHLDSALAGFMTLTPPMAEELGLAPTGSSTSTGVGTAPIATRFAMLGSVKLGPVTFRNVPVMVSDIHTLRGLKEGLVGTALLKRFNATIDVEAAVMDLFPIDRPDLLRANIKEAAVMGDVPLYIFDQTVVEAAMAGAPPALYILDSAAATNLVDTAFFEEHIKPKIDPARIVQGGIRGAGGPQAVRRVDGLPIALGPLVFEGQQVNEFRMGALNEISGRYAAGLLGNPILWPYRVHMDFRAGRLILERYPGTRAGRPARPGL